MISASYSEGYDAMKDVLPIRELVFVKEQGMHRDDVTDALDDVAIHVVAYEGHQPVGAGRLIISPEGCSIGKIAVIKEKRKKYYGDLIVRMLIQKGFDLGAKAIMVHAQHEAIPFYETIGFEAVGEVYERQAMTCRDMILKKDKIRKKCHK